MTDAMLEGMIDDVTHRLEKAKRVLEMFEMLRDLTPAQRDDMMDLARSLVERQRYAAKLMIN